MKKILRVISAIVFIPVLLMFANLVVFALVGYGFLPEANDSMQVARVFIAWGCFGISGTLWAASI